MKLSDTYKLARKLLNRHGFKDWKIKFTDTLYVMGRCDISKKCIELSKRYIRINKVKVIKDIILHEIAHALVPMTAKEVKLCQGRKQCPCFDMLPCHSNRWARKAKKIGCDVKGQYIVAKVPKRKKSKK